MFQTHINSAIPVFSDQEISLPIISSVQKPNLSFFFPFVLFAVWH